MRDSTARALILTALVVLGASVPSVGYEGPNVIVLMIDDLEEGLWHAALDSGLMPELAHAAEGGVNFRNSFVSHPLCAPSRASFLTGQYAHNHRVMRNQPPSGGASTFLWGGGESRTVAGTLRARGYRTGYVGKYLNGYNKDRFRAYWLRYRTYGVPVGWDDWQASIGLGAYRVYDYEVFDNGRAVAYGQDPADYQTRVLARRAEDFVRESDSRPFFLVVNVMPPHLEEPGVPRRCESDRFGRSVRPHPDDLGLASSIGLPMPPSFDEADVSDKPFWFTESSRFRRLSAQDTDCLRLKWRERLESVLSLENLYDGVEQAVRDVERLDDTVFVLTSDNGYFNGEHRLTEKGFPYDEAIRVPLHVWGAAGGSVLPQREIEDVVLNIDLAPSILHAATGRAPQGQGHDGRSLVPLITDPSRSLGRKRFLLQHWGMPGELSYRGLRTGPDDEDLGRNLLYVEYLEGDEVVATEFYNMEDAVDPFQLENKCPSAGPCDVDSCRDIGPADDTCGGIDRVKEALNGLISCRGAACRSAEG